MPTAHLERDLDRHSWTLNGFEITQLSIDSGSVRFQLWTFDSEAEVRFGSPFEYVDVDGRTRVIDPERAEQLAPLLTLTGRSVTSVVVARNGELAITFGDGSRLVCPPDPQYEAWEIRGRGDLVEMAYLCMPGGGSPWGAV